MIPADPDMNVDELYIFAIFNDAIVINRWYILFQYKCNSSAVLKPYICPVCMYAVVPTKYTSIYSFKHKHYKKQGDLCSSLVATSLHHEIFKFNKDCMQKVQRNQTCLTTTLCTYTFYWAFSWCAMIGVLI